MFKCEDAFEYVSESECECASLSLRLFEWLQV